METENRLATAGLNQQLRDVRSFSFFQLASLLRRFEALQNAIDDVPLDVRYRALPSLGFPAADVDQCEVHQQGFRQFLDVTVTFMGLFGPASPLPAFYTERIIQSTDMQSASRDLMDIFNHRCITLLQVCWEKYRYYTQYQPDGRDHYTRWLLSLAGLNIERLEFGSRLRWHRLLPFVGVLSNNVSSTDLLVKVVASYFSVASVEVEPWIARQITIAEDQLNQIGMMNCTLDEDLMLGGAIADLSGKFALHLRGLTAEQYGSFLPEGDCFAELVELVRFVLRDPLDFDLHLAADANRKWRDANGEGDGRLGWNMLLGEPNSSATRQQTVICVHDFQTF